MKNQTVKNKFLEELARTSIVGVACERSGISRQTYYRWRNVDSDFYMKADQAMAIGVELNNDLSESVVLNAIRQNDVGTAKWYLSNRHKEYRRPFIVQSNTKNERETKHEYEARLKEAQKTLKKSQSKWFVNEHVARKKEAQKLFDEWKRNYLDSADKSD